MHLKPEKKEKQYSDYLGAKKELKNESAKSTKVMISIW
jgi:hypothetical protein